MKNALLLSLLVLCFPRMAQADLVIYREAENARVTAVGRSMSLPVTTYIVHDTGTGEFRALGLFKVGPTKYYAVTNSSGYQVTHGIAGPQGEMSVVSRVENSSPEAGVISSAYFARGRTATLNLGNGTTARFPRSLKAITRGVSLSSGQLALYESTSTLVFQSTETTTANTAGETAEATVERLRQRFAAQGYVPVP